MQVKLTPQARGVLNFWGDDRFVVEDVIVAGLLDRPRWMPFISTELAQNQIEVYRFPVETDEYIIWVILEHPNRDRYIIHSITIGRK